MATQTPTTEESELLLSAKYMYFDDRQQPQINTDKHRLGDYHRGD